MYKMFVMIYIVVKVKCLPPLSANEYSVLRCIFNVLELKIWKTLRESSLLALQNQSHRALTSYRCAMDYIIGVGYYFQHIKTEN